MDRHAEGEERVMPSHIDTADDIEIRNTKNSDIQAIYKVLSKAFEPYKQDYTQEAYNATVISACEIEKRMNEQKTEVLVAVYHNKIVGTATITTKENGELYIRSMAVKPNTQRKGMGMLMLEEIDRRAKQKHCKIISLECFEPLTKATKLYEKSGFKRTGRQRSYYGIKIFGMKKDVLAKKTK